MSASHATPITVRFGNEILEAGFTTIPNLVLDTYHALGITPDEMMFTIHVWQFWWGRGNPYPSLGAIAERMGKSWRSVHRYAKSLEDKGYLTITARFHDGTRQTSSEYDYTPLLDAVVALGRTPAQSRSVTTDRAPVTPMTERALSPMTAPTLSPVTDEEDPEETDIGEEELRVERLRLFIQDFGREFRDRAPVQSSLTRAVRLWESSELEWDDFQVLMYEARARTKRAGNVRNRMAFWFATLEDLLRGGSDRA